MGSGASQTAGMTPHKRRLLLGLTAAALFIASIAFPYWTVMMRAPAYPEQALTFQVYAYKYAGDIEEWNRVGRLVGVHVPPPVPEVFFLLFPGAVLVAAGLAVVTALTDKGRHLAVVFPWVLLLLLLIWGQYSLYVYGHALDPDRPLRYLEPFTPPVVGITTLGKIKTYHFPNVGSLLFFAGAALLVVRAWPRRRSTTDPSTTATEDAVA